MIIRSGDPPVANGRATLRDSYPPASITGQLPSGSTHGCYWGLSRGHINVRARTFPGYDASLIYLATLPEGPTSPVTCVPCRPDPALCRGLSPAYPLPNRGPWGSFIRGSWWGVSRGLTLQGIHEGYVLFGPYNRTCQRKDFPGEPVLNRLG